MHTPKSAFETHEDPKEPVKVDTSLGYEGTDVKVSGIVVFLTALGIFVVVTALLCVVIGKVINTQLTKFDGPPTKWDHPVDTRGLGNLATNPEMQGEFAKLANRFPTPRLQTDDGYEEIYRMHQQEDLLLENYSWIGNDHKAVRIPIERAMELVAAKGLKVAAAPAGNGEPQEKTLAGAELPVVKAPLTNGFARTGYEQEQTAKQEMVKPE